jgi:UDP-galactopyranose mutase
MIEIAIAGAGFSGAVLARELADTGRFHITVFDERPHVAGNCYTARDQSTGIMVHEYGPHIFHTNHADIWQYMNRWATFGPYVNRVKAITARGVFSLPINLLTINQFFGKSMDPSQARSFIEKLGNSSIGEPKTFEEQALKFLGRDLYENFFRGYTCKQWGIDPRELPASILQRLPVRFNYDDNYYSSRYQGIPLGGYTEIVEKILDHSAITVRLEERLLPESKADFAHIFWSGAIDSFFRHRLGRLQYRTLRFERFEGEGDHQGNAVINYCEDLVPFTRVTEHKHFAPWENHSRTICFREYSDAAKSGDVPYYPLRLAADKARLDEYVALAKTEKNVTFIGRLGTYRYLDMHAVIGESLDLAAHIKHRPIEDWARFSTAVLGK